VPEGSTVQPDGVAPPMGSGEARPPAWSASCSTRARGGPHA
jgi:hypothetical protein